MWWRCQYFYVTYTLLYFSSSLPHVINYDSVTVCDGRAKQIKCPSDENIHILQGFYGKWRNHNCKGENPDPDNLPTCSEDRKKTTAIARDTCQGKNTCKLIADKSIFGEPCPDNKSYLYITFFCLAPGKKLQHQKTESSEEMVTVPSHGFVIEESRHRLEDKRIKVTEEKKKASLPPTNPSPDPPNTQNDNTVKPYHSTPAIMASGFSKLPESYKSLVLVEGEHAEQKSNLPANNMNKPKIIDAVSELSTNKPVVSTVVPENNMESYPNVDTNLPVNSEGASESNMEKHAVTEMNKDNSAYEKGVRSSTICNGQSKLIACLPEEGIKIHYAFYGKKSGRDCRGQLPYKDEAPTCSALDAKSNVENSCDGKQTCLLFADDNIYGKSLCPNVNKYLYLTYNCIPAPTDIPSKHVQLTPQEDLEEDAVSRSTQPTEKQIMTVLLCNGERRTISCKRDIGMEIHSAFYGKRTGKDCRGNLGYRDDIPECNNPRALDSVKFLCDNRKSCELASESALFGDDVCSGVNKFLEVTYGC